MKNLLVSLKALIYFFMAVNIFWILLAMPSTVMNYGFIHNEYLLMMLIIHIIFTAGLFLAGRFIRTSIIDFFLLGIYLIIDVLFIIGFIDEVENVYGAIIFIAYAATYVLNIVLPVLNNVHINKKCAAEHKDYCNAEYL